MKKSIPVYIFIISSFIAGCSGGATAQKDPVNNISVNAERIKNDALQIRVLHEQIEQIAAAAKGRVGMAAVVLETGESVSFNSKDHFPMQSVYKLPIGMAALRQVDEGKLKLEQKIKIEKSDFVSPGQRSPIRDKHPNGTELSVNELISLAVSESDGTASDVLMKVAGGPGAIDKYLKETGINEIIVANTEKEFALNWQTQFNNWASPDGAVALLRALHEGRGISQDHRSLLLEFMTASPTGPKRIKGLLPAGTVVAHKTGTSGSREGITAATNDIGIVTLPNGKRLAIAVFVADSAADEKTREETIARIAKAVWDKWGN